MAKVITGEKMFQQAKITKRKKMISLNTRIKTYKNKKTGKVRGSKTISFGHSNQMQFIERRVVIYYMDA